MREAEPVNRTQLDKVREADGFLAALDQSGGSTPQALERYGIPASTWADEDEMFDLVHQMRVRIMTSPAFGGDRILGAILFEQTMDREVEGRSTADYLWDVKGVVPFLKIDKGLADEADGSQPMRPIPDLDELCERGLARGMFGTKARSVIRRADDRGVATNVAQQFDVARRILAHGLVPIIEPEVDVQSPSKPEAERMLAGRLRAELDGIAGDQAVMLKLTLPDHDDLYAELVRHPRVLRVVALSGGYSRAEANARLARNHGVVASFSRALVEGLSARQTDDEFDEALDASIASTFAASKT